MFTIRRKDQVSAIVRDGVLYEADGVTPITDAVFINGLLMREVPAVQARQALAAAETRLATDR